MAEERVIDGDVLARVVSVAEEMARGLRELARGPLEAPENREVPPENQDVPRGRFTQVSDAGVVAGLEAVVREVLTVRAMLSEEALELFWRAATRKMEETLKPVPWDDETLLLMALSATLSEREEAVRAGRTPWMQDTVRAFRLAHAVATREVAVGRAKR